MTKRPTGICRRCRRVVYVRLDGTAVKHKPPRRQSLGTTAYWTCIGSYEKAKAR